MSTREAPLADVTVVEAANYIAGPIAGMVLADLGAHVIKVEPPRGDPYRRLGKAYGDGSLAFKAANQNKRSVTLDLKSEDGFASFETLLADADVLLTNWRPGVAERMGLTEESLRERFPRLIWTRVSGYGPTGPRAELPAYDGIIQARSGGISSDEGPVETNNNVADKVSAMFAAHTILAALHQRARTGAGSVCDVPMADVMAYFYGADAAAGHRIVGQEPDARIAKALSGTQNFETADGWLTLSPVSGAQIRRSMEALGIGDRFSEVMEADRALTLQVFTDLVAPPLKTRSALEWEEVFMAADVPAAAVRTFTQHLNDPQTIHNDTWTPVADPTVDGEWLLVRFPARFDGKPAETVHLPAPMLDTD